MLCAPRDNWTPRTLEAISIDVHAQGGQQEALPGEFPLCMRVGLHDHAPHFFVPTGEILLMPTYLDLLRFGSGQLGSGRDGVTLY